VDLDQILKLWPILAGGSAFAAGQVVATLKGRWAQERDNGDRIKDIAQVRAELNAMGQTVRENMARIRADVDRVDQKADDHHNGYTQFRLEVSSRLSALETGMQAGFDGIRNLLLQRGKE
jgi:hypothetical protein